MPVWNHRGVREHAPEPNGMVLTDLMPVRPPKTHNVNEVGVLYKEGRQGLRIRRVPGSSELLGDPTRVTWHG